MKTNELINLLKAYSRSDGEWRTAEVYPFNDYKEDYLILKKENGDKLFIHMRDKND